MSTNALTQKNKGAASYSSLRHLVYSSVKEAGVCVCVGRGGLDHRSAHLSSLRPFFVIPFTQPIPSPLGFSLPLGPPLTSACTPAAEELRGGAGSRKVTQTPVSRLFPWHAWEESDSALPWPLVTRHLKHPAAVAFRASLAVAYRWRRSYSLALCSNH